MSTEALPRQGAAYYISKALSYLLHPFLMPVYLVLVLFVTGLIPIYLPVPIKRYILGLVAINTFFVPAISIILLHMFRVIPNYSLAGRRDRIIPLFIMCLCYGLCGWMLSDIQMVFLLRRCMFAAMGCVLFAFVVNLFWQVSLHMTAIGGAVGIMFILLYGGAYSLIWLFCGILLLAGALGSARLYLGKHNLSQVAAGFFGGFVISVLVLLLSA